MSAICCCCTEVSTACAKLVGPRVATQIYHLFLIIMFLIPVILVTSLLNYIGNYLPLTPVQIITRMSFTLFILFFIIFLFMLCRSKLSEVINQGLFCIKYTVLVLLFVAFLFLPSQILKIYGQISKIASILFLIIQAVILIDVFYLFGVRLARNYSSGQTHYGGYLIGLTIIFQAIAIFLNIFGYVRYGQDICGNTVWQNVVTCILILILPVVQLVGCNPQNSLFTTSLVSLLISYQTFSALQDYGDSCSTRLTPVGYALDIAVNLILFALTTQGTLMGGFNKDQQNISIQKNQIKTQNSNQIEQLDYHYTNGSWIRWHFFMILGVMYIGMIFSNWQATEQIGKNLHGNMFGFWVKLGVGWATGVIYVWTMVAPFFIRDRDFVVND